jgi:hypothetical protein
MSPTTATPQVLLAHHLKQLRLPTMLREYDKLAQACASEGVDHPRYLLRLVELELLELSIGIQTGPRIGVRPCGWTV